MMTGANSVRRWLAIPVACWALLGVLMPLNAAAEEQEPRVLRVAVTPVPPLVRAEPGEQPAGMAVELLETLATDLGYELEFVRYPTITAYRSAAIDGEADLVPILPGPVATAFGLPHTRNFQTLNVRAFVRANSPITTLDEALRDGPIAVSSPIVAELVRRRNPAADVRIHQTFAHVVFALLSGAVDRAVSTENIILNSAERIGLAEEIRALPTSLSTLPMSIAGPPREAALVREFDHALGVFMRTAAYSALSERYLGEKDGFWSVTRLVWVIEVIAVLSVLALVTGWLLVRQERRQKRKIRAELDMRIDGEARRIREAIDQLETAIFALDPDGNVVMTNTAADRLVARDPGLSATEWLHSRTFSSLAHHETEATATDVQDRIRRAQPISSETVHLADTRPDPGGAPAEETRDQRSGMVVRVSGTPHEEDVRDYSYLLTITDVTAEHEAQSRLERVYRLEATGQLAGGLAHDFGNILGIIRLSSEVALRADRAERAELVTDRLQAIAEAARRGGELTERILAFARQSPAVVRNVQLKPFLDDFLSLAGRSIESSIDVSVSLEGDPYVRCDPGQLENALLNLILNARDALAGVSSAQPKDPVGRIGILAQKAAKPGFVTISITDNGPGMTEAVRRRATEPFFTTKHTSRGSGLGLAMVAAFVAQSDGELALLPGHGQSEGEQVGTTVRVTLPEGDWEEVAPARAGTPLRMKDTLRVLLVEDEPDLRAVMEIALASLGCSPLSAGDAAEALARLRAEGPVDVLLTDIVLPGGTTGFELARLARSEQPDLPTIYVSGYADGGSETRMHVPGPLLSKPVDTETLARAFDEVLETADADRPRALPEAL